jgi:pantoate--beta-alanine ligase
VWNAAREVMQEERARHMNFSLGQDAAYDNGLICGGQLSVFVEPVVPQPRAFIFGAGHISKSISKVATLAGFASVIVDNRGGAGGSGGANVAAKSQADGYTLFMPALSTFVALPPGPGRRVVRTLPALKRAVAPWRARGDTVALVPTMGALHAGHLALVRLAQRRADRVIVSIFVNPTQFGSGEDFQRYPRTLEEDLRTCAETGAHLVFVPAEATIYPRGRSTTFVEAPGLSHVLEGASRPGHFRGVATVVLALLEIVRPDLAVLGQKDYQQQLVIRRMVEDLHVPVELITVPTVREPDGLARSSRNRYLSAQERKGATVLYRALEQAREMVASGERQADRVRQVLRRTVESESLARLDYAEVADADSLEPLVELEPKRQAVALLAAWMGSTRLIDNALLKE